ncbi:TPA: hypothetical protein ACH3X2_003140 [Trebouxia sp. C0005]
MCQKDKRCVPRPKLQDNSTETGDDRLWQTQLCHQYPTKSDQAVTPNGSGTGKAGYSPDLTLNKGHHSELLATLRQGTLTSHNKRQLKQHEPSLQNALAKQQHTGRQGKKQPAAVGPKRKPAGKAKWQSQTEWEAQAAQAAKAGG